MDNNKGSRIASYERVVGKRLFLQYVAGVNKPAIWAFINEKDRRVYVAGSKQPLSAAMALIADLYSEKKAKNPQMKRDKRQLRFKLLEVTNDLRLMKYVWMDKYIELGYTIYNTVKMPRYTVDIYFDFKARMFDLLLVSAGKRVKFVKSFKTEEEALLYSKSKDIWQLLRESK